MTVAAARSMINPVSSHLLTPQEVARLFRVDPKTVGRWATAGKFPDGACIRTRGGHRRYLANAIVEVLVADGVSREEAMEMVGLADSH